MKKFFFDCGTRDTTASVALLALRVMIGLMMFIGHGLPKLQGFSSIKNWYVPDFFPLHYMTPTVSLVATIIAELGASALIILGLATRPAAFLLGFTMVVAAFGVNADAPWFVSPPKVLIAKELALLYLIPMIAIILAGGGAFSMDAAIHKEGKRRRW